MKHPCCNTRPVPAGGKAQPGHPALDRILTHPIWGLLALILVLGLALLITYAIALPISGWFNSTVVLSLNTLLGELLAGGPGWLSGMILNGVLSGVGTVLSFIPILLVFFTILALFEGSGYMARASRVTDRYLRRLGLPGQACIPLSMGFGCNTSAVLGCRMLKERRVRLLAMLLVPFVPCTSRMAVIAFLTPAFFGASAPWVTWGLISFNLVTLALVALLASHLAGTPHQPAVELALPPFRAPRPRAVLGYIGANTAEFIGKAGSLILLFTLFTWALSYFPGGEIETSYLATLGQAITPLGAWAGLSDWRLNVALLASLGSKENIVAVLAVLFPVLAGADLSTQVAQVLSPAARLAFLVIQMLFIPCAGTLAALRHESGSWKLPAFAIALMLSISLAAGALVYQMGK